MRFITNISIEEAGTVCNRFFDYDDGDFAMSISDNMLLRYTAVATDKGHILTQLS